MSVNISVKQQRPTALMDAVQKQDVNAITTRIKAGDEIGERDSYGQTALHWAAKYESIEIVHALIDAGASARAKDEDGETPLQVARSKGREEIAELLTQTLSKQKRFWQIWK